LSLILAGLMGMVSCASLDMGSMMGSLQAADAANNPKDESGNYIARSQVTQITYTLATRCIQPALFQHPARTINSSSSALQLRYPVSERGRTP